MECSRCEAEALTVCNQTEEAETFPTLNSDDPFKTMVEANVANRG